MKEKWQNKLRNAVLVFIAAQLITVLFNHSSEACDILVVSESASADGRPFIWKNRDNSARINQQVKYFSGETDAGGYVMVFSHDENIKKQTDGDWINSSGGINEAGFACVCASVYEGEGTPPNVNGEFSTNLMEGQDSELCNINTDLIRQAVRECSSVPEFEQLLQTWHEDGVHEFKVISGNFAVMDSEGNAALYEIFHGDNPTGYYWNYLNQYQYGHWDWKLRYYKFDANTGEVTYYNPDGRAMTGSPESDEAPSPPQTSWQNGKCYISDFKGFVNRTNSNTYIRNHGEERRWRAYHLLDQMAADNRLSYRNVMVEVAKDVTAGPEVPDDMYAVPPIPGTPPSNDPENSNGTYSTTYCISRAATRCGMVIDGVSSGEDPMLSVFWCNLGEPSIGVFAPYLPWAKKVSYLAWADSGDEANPVDDTGYFDSDSCLFNRAISFRETDAGGDLYEGNNTGSYLTGMEKKNINKTALAELQFWSFPLEGEVHLRAEEYFSDIRSNNSLKETSNLAQFSNYSTQYLYDNYTDPDYTNPNNSGEMIMWDFAKPWDRIKPVVSGLTPAEGDTGVRQNTEISVLFSRQMISESVCDDTFTLSADSVEVSGQAIYDPLRNRLVFTPDTELDELTTYTASVNRRIEDRSWNRPDEISWTFTTRDPTWPEIDSVSPADKATDVNIDETVSVIFSIDMNEDTIKSSTFYVYDGTSVVPGDISYDTDAMTAEFTPDSGFEESRTYTVNITKEVLDLDDRPVGEYSWTFRTLDQTNPSVVSTGISNGETGVPVNVSITAVMSEAMEVSTVNEDTFRLLKNGSPVNGDVKFNQVTLTAEFVPDADLIKGADYTAEITSGAKDLSGNSLSEHSWSFTTGNSSDSEKPVIISSSCNDNQTGISITQDISVAFSEAMNPSTINENTFRLHDGTDYIEGIITYDPDTDTVTFDPVSELKKFTTYTVTVTDGIEDLAGNSVDLTSWMFSTGSGAGGGSGGCGCGGSANVQTASHNSPSAFSGGLLSLILFPLMGGFAVRIRRKRFLYR